MCVCAIFSSYIIDLYRTFVDCYHRLNGDISLLWECQKFDPHRMETPDTIEIKKWHSWLRRRDDPRCKISLTPFYDFCCFWCQSLNAGAVNKCINCCFVHLYLILLYLWSKCAAVIGWNRVTWCKLIWGVDRFTGLPVNKWRNLTGKNGLLKLR